MPEFIDEIDITVAVIGKTISRVRQYDNHGEDYLQFNFTDGTKIRFRYDWIYEWETGTIFEDPNEL